MVPLYKIKNFPKAMIWIKTIHDEKSFFSFVLSIFSLFVATLTAAVTADSQECHDLITRFVLQWMKWNQPVQCSNATFSLTFYFTSIYILVGWMFVASFSIPIMLQSSAQIMLRNSTQTNADKICRKTSSTFPTKFN